MDYRELPESLQRIFTPEIIELILQSLRKGYETAIELHDDSRGGNETTFGIGLYNYNVFELTKASKNGAPFKVKRTSVFRLKIGDCTLACHRVGRTAADDIWQSYPGNVDATARLIQEQLEFTGDGFDLELGSIRRFMIAHLGNSVTGLEAVYLTVPRKTAIGIEWVFAFLLWKREAASMDFAVPIEMPPLESAPAPRAPEEQIPDQAVPRKKKKKDNQP